ncbi:MAG: hypothetical protein ACI8XD_001919, partial [Thermoproteota archaeon]
MKHRPLMCLGLHAKSGSVTHDVECGPGWFVGWKQ